MNLPCLHCMHIKCADHFHVTASVNLATATCSAKARKPSCPYNMLLDFLHLVVFSCSLDSHQVFLINSGYHRDMDVLSKKTTTKKNLDSV